MESVNVSCRSSLMDITLPFTHLQVRRQSVMYRRLEHLSEVFPEDTRDSLMYLGDSEDNFKHNDVRYEIPFYVGGQRDRPKTSTFRYS